ncbi:MAG: hypothetical protein HKN12_01355 [Gemmatimonadetes bacterium]|nr:hypothetical protein [Gemmatimonadota bacterium]
MTRTPAAPRWNLLLWLIPIGVMSVHLTLLGPMTIDDAYISCRYAANAAAGDGLVFNAGERVQGFTNPLLTLVMAAGALVGVKPPVMATAVGALSAVFTAGALIFFLRGVTGRVAGVIAALGLLSTPEFVLNSLSGMETSLFCACLLGASWAFERKRFRTAGVFAGLLVLTRPDGIVWLIPAAVYLALTWRTALRAVALPAALIAGAWYAFATFYYGSPVPHSIAAKQLIHPGDFLAILQRYLEYLGGTRGLLALWVLAAIALVAEVRRGSRVAFLGLGSVFYLLVLSASGVMPFEVPRYFLWYPVPVIPVAFLLAARGAQLAGETLSRTAHPIRTTAIIALAPTIFSCGTFLRMWENDLPDLREHFRMREEGYRAVAAEIRRDAGGRTADVLVGEVGVVGYHLLDHRVHDSAGINSPEILRLREADRARLREQGAPPAALAEGSPAWVLDFLREERPEYVTTLRMFLHLGWLEQNPAFQALYEPVGRPEVWLGTGGLQHTVYGRRDRNGSHAVE